MPIAAASSEMALRAAATSRPLGGDDGTGKASNRPATLTETILHRLCRAEGGVVHSDRSLKRVGLRTGMP